MFTAYQVELHQGTTVTYGELRLWKYEAIADAKEMKAASPATRVVVTNFDHVVVYEAEEKTPLTCYVCPICKGEIALQRTPGNELAYHCQNAACSKVVMLGAEEALGTVEGMFWRAA